MNKKEFILVCIISIFSMNVYAGDFEKSIVEIKEKIQQSAETGIIKTVEKTDSEVGAWNVDYFFSISPTFEYIAIFTVVSPSHSVLSVTDIDGTNRRLCLYGDSAFFDDIESSRIIWETEENILYFAGSPIYGIPGIYKWDIEENKIERIVKPKNITKAFPDGFDYFVLLSISPNNRYLYYYHSLPEQCTDIQDIEHLYYVDLKTGKTYKIVPE